MIRDWPGNKPISEQWYVYCAVIAVDYTEDTCDLVELDEAEAYTCIMHRNIPIYYHCQPD
ncbi:hypothetical protein MBAV_004336, partial [Candidatus Magnetobacterium bavaricum]